MQSIAILQDQLNRISHIELLPLAWSDDFPYLPSTIFSEHPLLLMHDDGLDSRARFAFERLLRLGRHVRDRTKHAAGSPGIIEECKRFNECLVKDARITRRYDAFIAFTKRTRHTTQVDYDRAAKSMQRRLERMSMACDYDDGVVLTGIVQCGSKLAIVVQYTDDPIEGLHTLALLDFARASQDLRNAIVIVLVLCFAREQCIRFARADTEHHLARRMELCTMEDSDEDA